MEAKKNLCGMIPENLHAKAIEERNSLASKLWVIMWSWYSKNASKEEKSLWQKPRLSHSRSPRSWISG